MSWRRRAGLEHFRQAGPASDASSGLLDRRAGGEPDFSLSREPEMRPHGLTVISAIVERNALHFRHQCIDLERTDCRCREPWAQILFHLRSAAKASCLAAYDRCCLIG